MTPLEHERTTQALKILESYKYEVKPLWTEFRLREERHEKATPSEYDVMYTCAEKAPETGAHFAKGDDLPQNLASHVLWAGHHYTLTPGQREWFRENTALTPSQTVTIAWVEVWPGTKHLRSFKVVSDVHVDPRHRRHILNEYAIREAGKFFYQSAQNDAREKATKVLSLAVGPVNVWSAAHRFAVKELSGSKFDGTVEDITITFLDNRSIIFENDEGSTVEVDRDEFLSLVAEYTKEDADGKRLPREKKPSAKIKREKTFFSNLDDMVADLEESIGE